MHLVKSLPFYKGDYLYNLLFAFEHQALLKKGPLKIERIYPH